MSALFIIYMYGIFTLRRFKHRKEKQKQKLKILTNLGAQVMELWSCKRYFQPDAAFDQCIITFVMFCVLISLHGKNAPKYLFSFVPLNENFDEWSTHFEFGCGKFLMFYAEIWRRCCPIIKLKKYVGEFLFFASFKTYDCFSEENACFINF